MNKQEYIINFLENNIKDGKELIEELEKINSEIYHLPNDCYGIEIDGKICKNPNYKLDILTGNNHTIGYMNGLIEISKKIIMFIKFNEYEFQDFLKKNEIIKKQNNEIIQELTKHIISKNKK